MKESEEISSLYIHFPFCRHLCNYCDFYKKIPSITYHVDHFEEYLTTSISQLDALFERHGACFSPLKSLYIGGGTPSLWGERGADFLENFFQANKLELALDCEATLEVNPGSWTAAGIDAWRKFGINRFSLGVQSLNPQFMKVLDRVHGLNEVHDILAHFQKIGVRFSVDFMLGLPYSHEWKRDINRELDEILSFSPDHLSLYILTVKGGYPLKSFLPDEDYIAQEYLFVAEKLKSAGLQHYEVSNFALPGKESRHNLRYWESESVAALGPSATGLIVKTSGHEAIRYKWDNKAGEMLIESLGPEELALEQFYLKLRTNLGLDLGQYTSGHASLLSKWESLNYIDSLHPLRLSSQGYLMIDSLMNDFFNSR